MNNFHIQIHGLMYHPASFSLYMKPNNKLMTHAAMASHSFLLPPPPSQTPINLHVSLLQNSLNLKNPFISRSIHAHSIKTGLLFFSAYLTNNLINCYIKSGFPSDAQKLFDQMPNKNLFSWNTILGLHAKSGEIELAREVFDRMPERDSVSWTTLIVGLNRVNWFKEAIETFLLMLKAGISLTKFTFTNILSACGVLKSARAGKKIHSFVVKLGFSNCLPVGNSLINMYGKCGYYDTAQLVFDKMSIRDVSSFNTVISLNAQTGQMGHALKLFDEMPDRNVISWNAILAGFNQNGLDLKALDFFSLMMKKCNLEPDNFTLISVLSSCANCKMLKHGKQNHAYILKKGTVYNKQITNSLISMYAKCGEVKVARRIVDNCVESNFDLDEISYTALLEGYVKKGELVKAREIFDMMKYRDVIAWTAMIVGYEQNGLNNESMDLFRVMIKNGPNPNFYTLAAVLSACAHLEALDLGKEIHCKVIRSGQIDSVSVSNAVITMYAKNGDITGAKRVFDKIRDQNENVTWTSMVVALAQHGLGKDALKLFDEMTKLKIKPDYITYIGVLSACVHVGLVEKGKFYYNQMQNVHMIKPNMSHYACMIDLFSRSGKFEETEDFIAKMPFEPDKIAWGAILNACMVYRNAEVAKKAAEKLLFLDPWNSGAYSALANVYSVCGKWNEAAKVWNEMRDRGIRKEKGVSLINAHKERLCKEDLGLEHIKY